MQESTDEPGWARCQSMRTLQMLGSDGPRYGHHGLHFADNDTNRLLPSITRIGGMLYERLLNEEHPSGCWRRTTMQQYRELDNAGEVVVDVGQLNADEHTEWVLCGFWSLPPKHEKAIVQLRNVAEDIYALREWDLRTCTPVPHQEFRLTTTSPSEVAWLEENGVLLMSALNGGDNRTQAGEAGTVRLWMRGTLAECAPVLFVVAPDHILAKAFRDWGAEDEAVVYVDVETPLTNVIYLGRREGPYVSLPIPKTSLWVIRGEQLAILLKEDWSLNGGNYEAGTIVGVSVGQLFAENTKPVQLCDSSGFQEAFLDQTHLVILFRHNLRYFIRMFKPANGWLEVAAQPLPAGEVMSIATLDDYAGETDSTLLLTSQGPLTPPAFWTSSGPDGKFELLRQAPTTFNTVGYSLTDHHTGNLKGESIPYIMVGPPGTTAEQPVCLIFCGPDMIPGYNTILGQRWLEPGGAIIFVPSDYSDTVSSVTDATCIVTDLVTNDVTVPRRIAILGAFEHGAALIEIYPVSEGIFAAFGSYNPRWSSEVAFRSAGRLIQGHKGAQQHGLLIGCNSLSDPFDTRKARRLGETLQRFDYRVNYYESGMDGSGSLEDPAFLLALQLEFFRQKIGWIRETVPALPNVFT
ncbi:hypothetical protein M409DRAFT_30567 [Zasmidium cellare ATCC 36951]|uniref:Peptidase S9 prolyl oligopeptidase catalytic domain-containing protein n=1 Tax=Zasmidium cellare ATCC 36951 TaxID=1080233 RepID=A0A6A6BW53_ZASCE|nr:uncharacterized protein M409DRAFT_30567 [Zasmidium cellare ATCC 36951]KAF2158935.1 hypothetical protein M409DRAFT_30567 [Zasmidium cellare ATCC 36951]